MPSESHELTAAAPLAGQIHVLFFLLSFVNISYYCFCSAGGKCLSVEYTDKVGEIAVNHGLKLHIDGARIFNASVVST